MCIEPDNALDRRTFWVTTYGTPILWCVFIIVSVLSFSLSNVTVCMFGFALSFSNLMGYIKCEKDHKAKVSNFIFTQAKDKLTVE